VPPEALIGAYAYNDGCREKIAEQAAAACQELRVVVNPKVFF
jgi:hypothetical protein